MSQIKMHALRRPFASVFNGAALSGSSSTRRIAPRESAIFGKTGFRTIVGLAPSGNVTGKCPFP
jgi:hypothetical protein